MGLQNYPKRLLDLDSEKKHSGDYLLAGWPVLWLLGILLIALCLSYFSNRLFQLEMKSIYGDLIKRLDDMLVDLEQLR